MLAVINDTHAIKAPLVVTCAVEIAITIFVWINAHPLLIMTTLIGYHDFLSIGPMCLYDEYKFGRPQPPSPQHQEQSDSNDLL